MDDEAVARQIQREINGMRPASPRARTHTQHTRTPRSHVGQSAARSPSPVLEARRSAEDLGLQRGLMLVDMHDSDVAWTLLFGWTAECLNTCHTPELVTSTNLSITMVRSPCRISSLACCLLTSLRT